MAEYIPGPNELSVIEQIETVIGDVSLSPDKKDKLLKKLWTKLESEHGSDITQLQSPEGNVITRPSNLQSLFGSGRERKE